MSTGRDSSRLQNGFDHESGHRCVWPNTTGILCHCQEQLCTRREIAEVERQERVVIVQIVCLITGIDINIVFDEVRETVTIDVLEIASSPGDQGYKREVPHV